MNNYKNKVNKQHNHQPQVKLVTGRDYDNPNGRAILDHMAVTYVEKYFKPYSDRHLNTLIRLETQPLGYSRGYEIDNQLQILLCATIDENWWLDRRDCHIICILKNASCPTNLVQMLLSDCEKWARQMNASSVNIYSWDNRRAYDRWCERLGYHTSAKTYTKELQ
jgi:hypothetical protein